jgi:SagB-type dehydrogenase family enzyme
MLACLLPGLLTACLAAEPESPPGTDTMTKLPAPTLKGSVSLEETLARRRSVRSFADTGLTESELGQLLWAAQGVTDSARQFRTAPSAGATFPLETYAATPTGVFRYRPKEHALQSLATNDVRAALAEAALGQACVRTAGAVVAFAAVPGRTTGRYGARGLMYVHMEAGHAAQNVHLQAVALGLGSVAVGAFDADQAARVLGLPEGETLLYLVPVGRPAR